MFSLTDSDTFYLYPYPTDMRKSFYSLSGIVTNQMGMDIQDGTCFIFVNRSCTCMKILHMEGGGLVIYHMKLAQGQFAIPNTEDQEGEFKPRKTAWSELVLMVLGMEKTDLKQRKRWTSSGKKDSKKVPREDENRP